MGYSVALDYAPVFSSGEQMQLMIPTCCLNVGNHGQCQGFIDAIFNPRTMVCEGAITVQRNCVLQDTYCCSGKGNLPEGFLQAFPHVKAEYPGLGSCTTVDVILHRAKGMSLLPEPGASGKMAENKSPLMPCGFIL